MLNILKKTARQTTLASAVIAAAFVSSQALAIPQGAYWAMVDNSTNNAGGGPPGLSATHTTMDLYVALEVGDSIAGFDFGIAGPNIGLSTDGAFYYDALFSNGSVRDNIVFSAVIPDLEYSSAVTVNGGAIISVLSPPVDWSPAGVIGSWFVTPAQLGAGGPNGPDDMWVARVTVTNAATFLGGQMFVLGTGPNGDFGQTVMPIPRGPDDTVLLGVVDIPNAIPTPGAASLLTIASLAALRRRR